MQVPRDRQSIAPVVSRAAQNDQFFPSCESAYFIGGTPCCIFHQDDRWNTKLGDRNAVEFTDLISRQRMGDRHLIDQLVVELNPARLPGLKFVGSDAIKIEERRRIYFYHRSAD